MLEQLLNAAWSAITSLWTVGLLVVGLLSAIVTIHKASSLLTKLVCLSTSFYLVGTWLFFVGESNAVRFATSVAVITFFVFTAVLIWRYHTRLASVAVSTIDTTDGTRTQSVVSLISQAARHLSSRPTYTDIVDIYLDTSSTGRLGNLFVDEIKECDKDEAHVLNQKFMYTGLDEALAWEALCANSGYRTYQDSVRFFTERMSEILDDVYTKERRQIALVALGVGSGGKETEVLRHILKRQDALVFYPVDSSIEMLCLSLIAFIRNLKEYQRSISFKGILGDFKDLSPIRRIHDSGVQTQLFAFLGNTIGNESETQLLRHIWLLMDINDLLLVDAQIIPTGEPFDKTRATILQSYDFQPFKHFVMTPLKKLGFDPEAHGSVETLMLPKHPYQRFRGEARAYTVYYDYIFSQRATGHFAATRFEFRPDQRIRLGHSVKYSVAALETILRTNGFTPLKSYVLEPGGRYGVVLARKKPGSAPPAMFG